MNETERSDGPRIRITQQAVSASVAEQLARDVRAGLTSTPKTLPPKYFYDARGSRLFEDITRLPEYYQTRAETRILERIVDDVIAHVRPEELVEIGSGSSRKTRLLLEAMHRRGTGRCYVPFDVSEDALRGAAHALTADYPWLEVEGVVGDFEHHLEGIPRRGRRLVAFLGSTIGNLHPDEQPDFLRDLAGLLRGDDALLLGFDLVKDSAVLEAAYDDAAGVTAEFNKNVLHVLNRELDAQLPVDAFEHVARYDAERQWIEMLLRATRDVDARFPTLDLDVHFARGEDLRTEISCKFTRRDVEALLHAGGLALERWESDEREWFGVVIARARRDDSGRNRRG